jgi:hypothetical protein
VEKPLARVKKLEIIYTRDRTHQVNSRPTKQIKTNAFDFVEGQVKRILVE